MRVLLMEDFTQAVNMSRKAAGGDVGSRLNRYIAAAYASEYVITTRWCSLNCVALVAAQSPRQGQHRGVTVATCTGSL